MDWDHYYNPSFNNNYRGSIGGYIIYKNSNKEIQTVELQNQFTATEPGQGIGEFAKCPENTKVISGGCSSDSAPSIFILHGGQPTQSNSNIDYNDAWICSFSATEVGTFSYTVTANCI